MFSTRIALDLTLLIDERLPSTWPGHVPFVRRTWNWYEEVEHGPEVWLDSCGPYFTEMLLMDEHIGTHFDAPAHFLPDRAPGEDGKIDGADIPLETFVGNAVIVDVTGLASTEPGMSVEITPHDLLAAEGRLGRQLAPGDVVLFRSDWDARYYRAGAAGRAYAHDVLITQRTPGWPAPYVPAIELLLERGIRCVGTDAPSMGPSEGGAPVHVAGLGGGMVFLESVANLRTVPPTGAYFQFMPIRIARSSGGPGRAVAWIERSSSHG